MQYIPHILKCMLTALLMQLCISSLAQNYNGLNGETVISGDHLPHIEMVATANRLYAKIYGEIIFSGTTYDNIWTPPPPYKIVSIRVKGRNGNTGESGRRSEDELMVLLSNGDVYKLTVTKGFLGASVSAENYWGKVGSTGSESWRKIIGDDIYVLSSSHLYTSGDSSHWKVDSAGLNGAYVTDVAVDLAQKVYITTDKGLFVQPDGSHPFTKVVSYAGPQSLYRAFVNRTGDIYIAVNGSGIYKSTDAGVTWFADTTGAGGRQPDVFADDAFGNIYFTCFDANTKLSGIYKSAGGVNPWQAVDSSLYNKTGSSPVMYSLTGDSVLILCTSFGVFKSADAGKTWVLDNKGIIAENIGSVAKTPGGSLLASTKLGIYRKKPGSTDWNKIYPAGGFVSFLPIFDNGFGETLLLDNRIKPTNNFSEGYLLKTPDGGDNWSPDTIGLNDITGGALFIDEKGAQHLGSGFYGSGVPGYLSQMWSKQKNSAWVIDTIGFPLAYYSFTRVITSDKKGYLYATGNLLGKKVLRRAITGGAWAVDTAGIPSTINYFDKLKGNNGDVVGATNNRVLHRGNGTWADIPLPAQATYPYIYAISIDESGYIFVAIDAITNSGVYFTNDLGITWKYAGLDSTDIADLVAYGDTTYVLSRNRGLLVLTHNSALPVTLSTIKAYNQGKGIQVEWSGYNEINMSSYIVERSANGNQFLPLGSITAKNNNAPANTYTYFDAAPYSGDNYYRIKAISKNGNTQYSGIVKVTVQSGRNGILVYPNPTINKTVNIQLNNMAAGRYAIIMYNAAGQRVYATNITYSGGNAAIAVNAHSMATGLYTIVLQGNGYICYNRIILK